MSRRDREKAARASATEARPGKVSKSRHLQAIVDAWDAWSPDSWSNQEKWIQGCNAVEAAIEAARTDVPNARTEANWLVEGLKDAAREADDRPEIHDRATIHGDLHAVLRELVEALDAAVLALRTDHSPARSSTGNRRVDDALEAARVAVDLGAKVSAEPGRLKAIIEAYGVWCADDLPRSSQSTRDLCSAIEAARAEIGGGECTESSAVQVTRTCVRCHGPELFAHLRDGHDGARHRFALVGIPIPSLDHLEHLATVQRAVPEVDVLQSVIDLYRGAR